MTLPRFRGLGGARGCESEVGNLRGERCGGGGARWREWPAALLRLSGRRAGRLHSRGPARSGSRPLPSRLFPLLNASPIRQPPDPAVRAWGRGSRAARGIGRGGKCAPRGRAQRWLPGRRASPRGKAPPTQSGRWQSQGPGHPPGSAGGGGSVTSQGGARGLAGGAGELGWGVTRRELVWLPACLPGLELGAVCFD